MKVMITGAAGFIGKVLTRYCMEHGASVLGLDVKDNDGLCPGVRFELCDVRNASPLLHLVKSFGPDYVFHLAAQSYPTVSLMHPFETIAINAGGTVNVFESVRAAAIAPLIVVACSSAEYGPVAAVDLPVKEDHPLRPLHPYGVSKVSQDLLAAQYFANYSIPCVRIRIFNTTGPGKRGDVCSDLTKRAAEIELGLRPAVLPVGNLDTRRAILNAHDLVSALWLSLTRCELGEVYNVCAAQTYSVQELVDMLRLNTTVPFVTQRDPALVRACDEPVIVGDSSKFSRATGWTETCDLKATVRDMLEWWRNRLYSETSSDATALHNARNESVAIVPGV
ncbi:MAG: GDP-mannose 4,6-dehydratase [Bryobacteraceae bacterium]